MITFQMLWVWNCRDERSSIWNTNIFELRGRILAVLISFLLTLPVIYTPLSIAFDVLPIGIELWILVIGVSLPGFLIPINRLFDKSRDKG